jgi:hypothetical protein
MTSLDDIKSAIVRLTLEERAELARWMHGWEDDEWDRQIAADASSGRLDHLLSEVDEEIREGRLRDLP